MDPDRESKCGVVITTDVVFPKYNHTVVVPGKL